MRWLAALLVSTALLPAAAAAQEDDEAVALALELISQLAQSGELSVTDRDALTARLTDAFTRFEQEAEARDVTWSMSWGIDVQAQSHRRHDPDGHPLPLDPATFEADDFLPRGGPGCEAPVDHPLSPASTADARWQACTGIEDDGDGEGPYYIGYSELLYGQDANYNWIRLAVAVTSPDAAYLDAMSGPATQLLYDLMDFIRADAIEPWPILGQEDGE